MTTNFFSTQKKPNFMATTHKTNIYQQSQTKEDPQTVQKSRALYESQREQVRNRSANLFSEERKENDNIFSKLTNKTYSQDQMDLMTAQHRMEIQKLLLQISRLHDMISDQDKSHKYEIERLKEDFQLMNHLQINNMKQTQFTQNQILQSQIRKLKEALNQRNDDYEDLEKRYTRERQNFIHQNEALKSDLKEVLDSKNNQIFTIKQYSEKELQKLKREKEDTVDDLKNMAEKQMRKIMTKLQEKEKDVFNLKSECERREQENESMEDNFENERHELQEKINKIVQENKDRQSQFMSKMESIIQTQLNNSEEEIQRQKQIYEAEIKNLFNLIQMKDKQNERGMIFRETQKMEAKYTINNLEDEVKQLKRLLFRLKTEQLQQVEALKIKMAVMHENDIKALVSLYETKIEGVGRQVKTKDEELQRMVELLKHQAQKKFEMKKKNDMTVSKLVSKIILLKNGMQNVEKNMKDKVQNERSMMMITSQHLIKDNELKNTNVKFYEEELRKLRQLLQIQANEVEQSERNVEQKIKLAEDELNRLSNKILQIKSESELSDKRNKAIIQEKCKQIDRLNELLIKKNGPEEGQAQHNTVGQQILKLQELLNQKQDQIRSLKGQVQDVNERIAQLRSENERLYIESQINTEDAKKHFKVLADKNLLELKKFYEKRLKELQEDKRELQKIITNQTQHITELVMRYKELQKATKDILKQSKKRGELENKIINLGMDNNLVKNMAQLFHK